MADDGDQAFDINKHLTGMFSTLEETARRALRAYAGTALGAGLYGNGLMKYFMDFNEAFWISLNYFQSVEREKLVGVPADKVPREYMELLLLNMNIAEKAMTASLSTMNEYHLRKAGEIFTAWLNTLLGREDKDIDGLIDEQVRLLDRVVNEYPEAIMSIRTEYGFHFEGRGYVLAGETERFQLYQVLPTHRGVSVKKNGKPVIIMPPFVLGTNILAFLPGEDKSYVHAFANRGIPTYIRVPRNIWATPAFQVMTGEDDARDTRYFSEIVKKKHGRTVTLNGYCQGGFSALCDILSGELDGLVDTLITCVSPMDGTRSPGLASFLKSLPSRFNDLAYGTKTLDNGNRVADGKLMGWVYKLRAIENEYPLVDFYRDLSMIEAAEKAGGTFNKTALAIKYWLAYERTDLPMEITRMSFSSYNTPILPDGTLPVRLFDRKLNLHRIEDKGVKWLICYGEKDDLVEKETALAPRDFIDVEVAEFPKGHLAIATSWSNPDTEFALDKRIGPGKQRGPVLFQLETDREGKGGR